MTALFAFLVTLIIIVGVHEFGHYVAARMCGVRVLAFAIGFGKPLLRKIDRHGTEWRFGPIPLGGYVLMLNDPEEAKKLGESPQRSLEGIPRYLRAWIIVAGPLANFLLSFVLFYVVALLGEDGIRAKIGRIIEDTPAAEAGFLSGDEIIAIDGSATLLWSGVVENVLYAIGNHDVQVEVKSSSGVQREIELPTGPPFGTEFLDDGELLNNIGLVPDSSFITLELATIIAGTPAEAAGLEVGDVIIAADDDYLEDWAQFVARIQISLGREMKLVIFRAGEVIELTAVPVDRNGRGYLGLAPKIDEQRRSELLVTQYYGPLEAVGKAFERTGLATLTTARFLRLLLFGRLDAENLSGPVGIARQSALAVSRGAEVFLIFIAQLSLSLGLINLIPIPVLDGGHLLRYAIEGVIRRPIPIKIMQVATAFGIAVLITLMLFTVYNDLT